MDDFQSFKRDVGAHPKVRHLIYANSIETHSGTDGVAPISPIYGATKAGLHSFTQSLRVQLKNTSIKVFELAPPSTQTPLQNGFDPSDTKGSPMMEVKKLVRQAIRGFQKDHLEILPGLSKVLRQIQWGNPVLPM